MRLVAEADRDEGAEHHHVALRKVDLLGGLVDQHEAERDQAVDAAVGQTAHHELQIFQGFAPTAFRPPDTRAHKIVSRAFSVGQPETSPAPWAGQPDCRRGCPHPRSPGTGASAGSCRGSPAEAPGGAVGYDGAAKPGGSDRHRRIPSRSSSAHFARSSGARKAPMTRLRPCDDSLSWSLGSPDSSKSIRSQWGWNRQERARPSAPVRTISSASVSRRIRSRSRALR